MPLRLFGDTGYFDGSRHKTVDKISATLYRNKLLYNFDDI
jgi:hypothetical protein